MSYHGQAFYVVSQEDLIASKRAAGRSVDLEDIKVLEINLETSKEFPKTKKHRRN